MKRFHLLNAAGWLLLAAVAACVGFAAVVLAASLATKEEQ